jgi:hypothetical protein
VCRQVAPIERKSQEIRASIGRFKAGRSLSRKSKPGIVVRVSEDKYGFPGVVAGLRQSFRDQAVCDALAASFRIDGYGREAQGAKRRRHSREKDVSQDSVPLERYE